MSIRNPAEAAFGAAMLLLAIAVLASTASIPSGFSYDAVGPRLFPSIMGIGLLLASLGIIAGSIGRRSRVATTPTEPSGPGVDWKPVAVISAGLLLEAALIETLGWIPLTATLFAAGAWAFGNRRLWLNLLIGFVFGGLILFAFDAGLGLDLPLGALAPSFQQG
ncbi:tripartite tricarboxylate transporter TctB family protein [Roseomonas gilardii]|uniref:Tripartite tricarboxylate transporter TctB family protein n=1 Tax=Roseomonas gilardii TaxID=257708 RepID=A0ABU3MIT0_9PROT|nr:tripartite tricarboxylate transporter TctB family protein [Roseomonas gilardii]MDT8332916.1 tripartite tricarboxylate transporter TctB family protein [Roseomonas gilardii]